MLEVVASSIETPQLSIPSNGPQIACNVQNAHPSMRSMSFARDQMRHRSGVLKAARDRMEKGLSLRGNLQDIIKDHLKHKEIYIIQSYESNKEGATYQVTIGTEPSCSCVDFSRNLSMKKYIPCKHMYFVYLHVKGLDVNENMFIHQPTLCLQDLFHIFALPTKGLPDPKP